ncbi:hypothetical protein C1886_00435 [Pseudomonas sp. FW300-N1A1]|uniref:hypothetical protein n=1 Tax=Pseudomonas sp. FW300-N1A1 TaxID=2075555 RepID=UPI000CD00CBB|nr:hypothetical protein [Pseudomonas sp. FW300-N1A1]POA22904.1 hypothetical protein C1886_00435 [Pseudomonas sp. FW300-N1A1]
MSITTRDWKAQRDLMPGAPSFRVTGTVTVAHPGITPKLTQSAVQHREMAGGIRACEVTLDLTLESADGNFLQVVTDKAVRFETSSDLDVTKVGIFYKGQLLQQIDEILTTH